MVGANALRTGLPNFEASIFLFQEEERSLSQQKKKKKKKGLYFTVSSRNVHAVQGQSTGPRSALSVLPGKAAVSATRRCRRRSLGSWSQACPVVTPFFFVVTLDLVAILSSRITAFHESEGRWNGLWNVTVRIRSSFHSTGTKKKRKDGPGNDACIPKDPNGQLQCKNCIWHECSAGRGVETRDP